MHRKTLTECYRVHLFPYDTIPIVVYPCDIFVTVDAQVYNLDFLQGISGF